MPNYLSLKNRFVSLDYVFSNLVTVIPQGQDWVVVCDEPPETGCLTTELHRGNEESCDLYLKGLGDLLNGVDKVEILSTVNIHVFAVDYEHGEESYSGFHVLMDDLEITILHSEYTGFHPSISIGYQVYVEHLNCPPLNRTPEARLAQYQDYTTTQEWEDLTDSDRKIVRFHWMENKR